MLSPNRASWPWSKTTSAVSPANLVAHASICASSLASKADSKPPWTASNTRFTGFSAFPGSVVAAHIGGWLLPPVETAGGGCAEMQEAGPGQHFPDIFAVHIQFFI